MYTHFQIYYIRICIPVTASACVCVCVASTNSAGYPSDDDNSDTVCYV